MYKQIVLSYNYNDLEPIISEETLKYHYEILYKGYVDNYNKTLDQLEIARKNKDFSSIKILEKNLAFYGAGAVLHTMYFENLEKHTSAIPIILDEAIKKSFIDFETFKEQFINNIINIEGSGWGILGYSKSLDKLIILQIEKHQDQTVWDFIPILVIDIWEHAYYLDYRADKKKYATDIFDIINWNIVSERLANEGFGK